MKVFLNRFLLFVIALVILCGISAFGFFLVLHSQKSRSYPNPAAATPPQAQPSTMSLQPMKTIAEEEMPAPTVTFATDLSAYEAYMNPANPDEYLTLINTKNTLQSDYIPADLTDVVDTRQDGRATQKMREYAEKSLEALFIEARANGVTNVSVTSAYRSYAYQEELFQQRLNQFAGLGKDAAYAKAATIVAIPGTSEHQSGLCADMHNLAGADTSFEETKEAKWLAENSYKFGFVLRFPKDKTEETGISFEPWHFRFVGRYHATKMYELGLCFEEYMEYLEKK